MQLLSNKSFDLFWSLPVRNADEGVAMPHALDPLSHISSLQSRETLLHLLCSFPVEVAIPGVVLVPLVLKSYLVPLVIPIKMKTMQPRNLRWACLRKLPSSRPLKHSPCSFLRGAELTMTARARRYSLSSSQKRFPSRPALTLDVVADVSALKLPDQSHSAIFEKGIDLLAGCSRKPCAHSAPLAGLCNPGEVTTPSMPTFETPEAAGSPPPHKLDEVYIAPLQRGDRRRGVNSTASQALRVPTTIEDVVRSALPGEPTDYTPDLMSFHRSDVRPYKLHPLSFEPALDIIFMQGLSRAVRAPISLEGVLSSSFPLMPFLASEKMGFSGALECSTQEVNAVLSKSSLDFFGGQHTPKITTTERRM